MADIPVLVSIRLEVFCVGIFLAAGGHVVPVKISDAMDANLVSSVSPCLHVKGFRKDVAVSR